MLNVINVTNHSTVKNDRPCSIFRYIFALSLSQKKKRPVRLSSRIDEQYRFTKVIYYVHFSAVGCNKSSQNHQLIL